MDKPEDKQPPQGPLKPPVPPPFGKKPGQPVPKGPVPPRAPGASGVPARPALPPPTGGAARPPMPPARPPMPSISGKPPLPPMPGQRPPMPPAAGGAPGAPLPPNVQNKFSEAEAATGELQSKISDLEKKLLEEREKVLLASLRSKEEEAVSVKVETSIKEIQDKLRREKREQELEENRRKAENRVAEMERRLAEEREAWVSTLKNQLGQRDSVTQEMESHFSTRLKDLEFRWAQEKASLEAALREREGDVVRIKQEGALKSEQEKGFWEDRLRSVAAERDKTERELERLRDRGDQEKAQLITERQMLRDQVAKAENALKFADEHARAERSASMREAEASINTIRAQAAAEKENYERQLASLSAQTQNFVKEIAEKSAQASALEQQIAQARAGTSQIEARVHGLDSQVEEWRRRAGEVEQAASVKRIQYEHQMDELRREMERAKALAQEEASRTVGRMEAEFNEKRAKFEADVASLNEQVHKARATAQDDAARAVAKAEADFVEKRLRYENEISNIKEELNRARSGSHDELVRMQARLEEDFSARRRKLEDELVQVRNQFIHDRQVLLEENARFKAEAEARIRTLQGRVDWYDANAKREYEIAREKVAAELEASVARAETAERAMQEIGAVEEQRLQAISEANHAAQRADEVRAAVQAELDQTRSEWKQVQWDLENRIKQMSVQISDKDAHAAQMEDGRVAVEQELRQRAESLEHAQATLKQQMDELNRLRETMEHTSGELELERERARAFQQQLDGYKEILQGRGVKTVDELKEQLDAKAEALDKARELLARMSNQVQDVEKKEDLFREKERIFKQLVADKEDQLSELKKKTSTLETRLVETQNDLASFREAAKRDKEMMVDQRQGDMARVQERVNQETERLARQFKEERDRIAQAQQAQIAQLAAKHAENLELVRKEAEDRLAKEIETARDAAIAAAPVGPEPEALELEIRQRIEAEFAEKLQEVEGKTGAVKDASKKEIDRIKWESENLREELKRARETRAHIEREAQELLGQAEAHFKKEVERVRADATKKAVEAKSGGMFTALGRFLDSPVIEFGGAKKKAPAPKQKQPEPKVEKAKKPVDPEKTLSDEDKQHRPAA